MKLMFYLENLIFFAMLVLLSPHKASYMTHWTVSEGLMRHIRHLTGHIRHLTGRFRVRFATGWLSRSEFHRRPSTRGVNFLSRMTKMERRNALGTPVGAGTTTGETNHLGGGLGSFGRVEFQRSYAMGRLSQATGWLTGMTGSVKRLISEGIGSFFRYGKTLLESIKRTEPVDWFVYSLRCQQKWKNRLLHWISK